MPDARIYYKYGLGIENIDYGNLRSFYIDSIQRDNYLDRLKMRKLNAKVSTKLSF